MQHVETRLGPPDGNSTDSRPPLGKCPIESRINAALPPYFPGPGGQLDGETHQRGGINCGTQVPVVMLDGEVIVDSSAIISRVAAEKNAEAAAAQLPPPKRGWFGKYSQPASPPSSHTGAMLLDTLSHIRERHQWQWNAGALFLRADWLQTPSSTCLTRS